MANPRVIKLLGDAWVQNEDCEAASAITPGMLVNYDGSGNLVPHATADGRCAAAFALEREEMGADIDTAYAIGDTVKVAVGAPGCRVNAWLVSGGNVAVGATLHSAGNGYLKAGTTAGVIVGRAVRAVNNTAGPGAARIAVEIM
jgi:hypothetical protein